MVGFISYIYFYNLRDQFYIKLADQALQLLAVGLDIGTQHLFKVLKTWTETSSVKWYMHFII